MIFTSPRHPSAMRGIGIGALAGLVGGAAEVAWVSLYASLSGADATAVARGVVGSLSPAMAASPVAVALGLAIHMVLAVALGVVITLSVGALLPRWVPATARALVVVAALVVVWAVNFLVVLPLVHPQFVDLLPYGVSLASKVLFGLAAAAVLCIAERTGAAGARG